MSTRVWRLRYWNAVILGFAGLCWIVGGPLIVCPYLWLVKHNSIGIVALFAALYIVWGFVTLFVASRIMPPSYRAASPNTQEAGNGES